MKKGPKNTKAISASSNIKSEYQRKFSDAAEKLFEKASQIPFDSQEQYRALNQQFQTFLDRQAYVKQLLKAMGVLLKEKSSQTQINEYFAEHTYETRKAVIMSLNKRVNTICYLLDQVAPLHQDLDEVIIPLHNVLWEDITYILSMIKTIMGENAAPIGDNHMWADMIERYQCILDKYAPYYSNFINTLVQEREVNLIEEDLHRAKQTLWNAFANFVYLEMDFCFVHFTMGKDEQCKTSYERADVLLAKLKEDAPKIIKISHLNKESVEKILSENLQKKLDWLKENSGNKKSLFTQRLTSIYRLSVLSGNRLRLALKNLITGSQTSSQKVDVEGIINALNSLSETISAETGENLAQTFTVMRGMDFNNTWSYILQLEESNFQESNTLLPHINRILLNWRKFFSFGSKDFVIAKLICEELEGLVRQSVETKLLLSTKSDSNVQKLSADLAVDKAENAGPTVPTKSQQKRRKKKKQQEPKIATQSNPVQAEGITQEGTVALDEENVLNVQSLHELAEHEQHSVGQAQVVDAISAQLSDLSISTKSQQKRRKKKKQEQQAVVQCNPVQSEELIQEGAATLDEENVINVQALCDLAKSTHSIDKDETVNTICTQLSDLSLSQLNPESRLEALVQSKAIEEDIATLVLMSRSKENEKSDEEERILEDVEPIAYEPTRELDIQPSCVHLPITPTDKTIVLDSKVKETLTSLNRQGYWAVVVGGAVRDPLLGISAHDTDIITNCPKSRLSQILKQPCVESIFVQGLFKIKKMDIVCTELTLEEELRRRDLTINTLIADRDGKVYDILGIIQDLDNPELVMMGDIAQRFQEDPSRILRLIRHCNHVNKIISAAYVQAIYDNASLLTTMPFGLYLNNIGAMFLRGQAYANLRALRYCKIYSPLIPNNSLSVVAFPWRSFHQFLSTKMTELDYFDQNSREEFYSPYFILALLLLPEMMKNLSSQKTTVSKAIEETSEVFCNTYQGTFKNEEKVVFKNSIKSMLEILYIEFNNYHARVMHAQKMAKQTEEPARPTHPKKVAKQPEPARVMPPKKVAKQIEERNHIHQTIEVNGSAALVFQYPTRGKGQSKVRAQVTTIPRNNRIKTTTSGNAKESSSEESKNKQQKMRL